jgi:hypothetical protein
MSISGSGLFAPADITGLMMPQGGKTSIARWLADRQLAQGGTRPGELLRTLKCN